MITLILPFHSDIGRLKATLDVLKEKMQSYNIKEILLCHNGKPLMDEQKSLIETYLIDGAKLLHTDAKGIGAGYKLGINNADQPLCVLSASDLPFGFTDIESLNKLASRPRLAIGSKAHPKSRIAGYGIKRKVVSFGFWTLRAFLLSPKTPKDSQGTILIETALAKELIKKSIYDNYFFSVELITLAQLEGVTPVELPVDLENHEGESSVSVVADGWSLAKNLVSFSKRVKRMRREN